MMFSLIYNDVLTLINSRVSCPSEKEEMDLEEPCQEEKGKSML